MRSKLQEKSYKNLDMWKFNSMVLNNGSLKKLNRKIKKYLETSENESTMIKTYTMSKSSCNRKFIVIPSYFQKQEKSQVNNLSSFLNQLEEEQAITKVSRRIKEDQSRNK